MKKSLLIFLFTFIAINAEEKWVFEQKIDQTFEEKYKFKDIEDSNEPNRNSVQIVMGDARGNLKIQNDNYDPSTFLTEFVGFSLISAALASPNYASALTGNLGQNSLLTLFLLNDEISSSSIRFNSRSTTNRFYLEHRTKNDFFSIQLGITAGTYAFNADSSRFNRVFLPGAFFGNTSPIFNFYMIQSFFKLSDPIYLSIDTFDLAMTHHFFPGKKYEPYFSLGVGAGSCFYNCYAFRYFGRSGLRINWEDHYLFLEGEINNVLFSARESKYNPLQERVMLLGFGFYL